MLAWAAASDLGEVWGINGRVLMLARGTRGVSPLGKDWCAKPLTILGPTEITRVSRPGAAP